MARRVVVVERLRVTLHLFGAPAGSCLGKRADEYTRKSLGFQSVGTAALSDLEIVDRPTFVLNKRGVHLELGVLQWSELLNNSEH